MAENIDREAAIRKLTYVCKNYGVSDATTERLTKKLKSIPAADVRPVVRGHFGKHTSPFTAPCSECGVLMNMRWNYCPNCGADMREES